MKKKTIYYNKYYLKDILLTKSDKYNNGRIILLSIIDKIIVMFSIVKINWI